MEEFLRQAALDMAAKKKAEAEKKKAEEKQQKKAKKTQKKSGSAKDEV